MTSADRVAAVLVWLWRASKAWLPQLLALVSSVLFIVWGAFGQSLWALGTAVFYTACGLALLSLITQIWLQRPSYMRLSAQVENAELRSEAKSFAIEKALTILLRKLAEHCNMAANSDRASVYFFHDDRFVRLARWAQHPEYTKPGRPSYPIRQGAIGEAWDRGSAVVTLPVTRDAWNRSLENKHGFAAGEATNLKMHCTSIAAIRVETDHAVGVLDFESIDQKRADQRVLDTLRTSKIYESLSELVGAVSTLTPVIEQAEIDKATLENHQVVPNWKTVNRGPSSHAQRKPQ